MNSAQFWQKASHLKIMHIALPMFLSNITQPLLGMVDTAVVGHMSSVHFLAGVAIAAMLITQLYWLCGAIRMTTTGLSAQAKGQESPSQATEVLVRSLFVALLLALLIFILQNYLVELAVNFTHPTAAVASVIQQYFSVRIWGAPAALANFVFIGWLLGQQCAKVVMLIQIAGNLLNVLLNFVFVYGFGMAVEGVALATVIAEYSMCAAAWFFIQRKLLWHYVSLACLNAEALISVLSLNSAMFVRNIALQLCLAFMVVQGARWGEETVALNNILHQFFVLSALGLDAVAYAVEALIGESKGRRDSSAIKLSMQQGMLWSTAVALGYSLIFVLFADGIIGLLTDLPSLRVLSQDYLLYLWIMPLVGHWCFLMDGVYIGLGRAKAMRNNMLMSAFLVFFPTFYLFNFLGNHALWIALLSFLSARGVFLLLHFHVIAREEALLD
ncbi:MATE family efflux transporter [Alteromonadaceae bacterium BrNp21-10]|nr:MATE family efflux transporter [Alteromonadaceae bacterium BrNp21-10]